MVSSGQSLIFINCMKVQVTTTSGGNCSAYTAIVINILEGLTTLTATLSHEVSTLRGAGKQMLQFSAPKICQTNILRHIHPSTIYPCKDKINLIDTSKQAKMQGIQDPSRSNVDNLNNVRRDARN